MILVEIHKENEWKFYCFLIEGADRRGHYGPAANAWSWAKEVCHLHPNLFRIVRKGSN